MGIELAIGAIAAAASVVTGVAQMSNAKKAARQQKEANNIANANQQNESADSRRRAIRDARIRQATIMQQSENAGVSDSSGSLGAVGVVNTNLASNNASAYQQTTATNGINAANQRAADYNYKAAQWGAFGNIFNSALGQFQTPQTKNSRIAQALSDAGI